MKRNTLIIIPLVLIILALGGWIYYLKFKTPAINSKKTAAGTEPSQQLVGNDVDAHGCKGSAGYTWCSTKNKCLRVWEEACPTDQKVLETEIMAALVAKHGESIKSLSFTISKIEGTYAQGGISGMGGGAMWFAAKIGDTWKLVWDGNGVILCTDLTDYPDFPKDMIPECWDASTNKNVTR